MLFWNHCTRDGAPGKKQVTFGIRTRINNIPSALTIQKGNVQDKTHFKHMFNIARKILEDNSILIFDCGANTKANKKTTTEAGYHYITLKAKKKKVYAPFIQFFIQEKTKGNAVRVESNDVAYECVKLAKDKEINYIFFFRKTATGAVKKEK